MVTLGVAIACIRADQVASDLTTLLQSGPARVGISWWAERIVTIEGYEGEVAINTLARKFLIAPQFHSDEDISLADRAAYDDLWETVRGLYDQSDVALRETWIYWIFTFVREKFAHEVGPRKIIRDPGCWSPIGRERLFRFTPERFQQLWPHGVEPVWKSADGCFWGADRNMVNHAMSLGWI